MKGFHRILRLLQSTLYCAVGKGQPLNVSKHGGDKIRIEYSEHTSGNTVELTARGQTRDRTAKRKCAGRMSGIQLALNKYLLNEGNIEGYC